MRDIYDIITLVNVPTDVATVLKNKHLFYRMCFLLNVKGWTTKSKLFTHCTAVSRRFVRKMFCQDRFRRFVRKTFCPDRFMQHFSHADRLRRFVRTALRVVTGGSEWLWAVMDDYGGVTGNAWELLEQYLSATHNHW